MGLLERFSSSGNIDPLAIIKAVNAEGSSEVESILTEGLEAMQKQTNEFKDREIAAQEQANEIEGQKIQIPIQIQQMKSDTEIKVKQMELDLKVGMQDADLEHKENMQLENRNSKLDEMMLAESGEQEEVVS